MNIIREAFEGGKIFICLFFALLASLVYNFDESLSTTTPVVDLVEIDNTKNNSIYIDWILKRSTKISRQTATDIYNTAMSMENGLLYIALVYIESNFNPTAVSKKGAIGLTQIMPGIWVKTLKEQKIIKEKKDLFDYDKSLLASKYILTEYYKKTGSWKKALNKYVGGDKKYANKVLAAYGELLLL